MQIPGLNSKMFVWLEIPLLKFQQNCQDLEIFERNNKTESSNKNTIKSQNSSQNHEMHNLA